MSRAAFIFVSTITQVSCILDNPIWHALNTGNKNVALGTAAVKYIKRDIGLFAGFENDSEKALHELEHLLPSKSQVILFTAEEIKIPAVWSVKLKKPLLQMVFQQKHISLSESSRIITLEDKHIPAMLALTKMTRPGPFFSGTIRLGHYEGIFEGEQLVAMIGQRLQPEKYTEVSAVCTHPDHTGKGYGAQLLLSQIGKITATSGIPFLHAYPDNPAVHLYEKVGFEKRKELLVYFLEKIS